MDQAYYKIMATLQQRHWWYEGRRRILAALIGRLSLPADVCIMEAGCGTGANLAMLSRFGTVSGFEPDEYARGKAQEQGAARIADGSLPGGMPFPESFDLVCAFDVIEHIDDDRGALASLLAATKPGGYAVFTVPAFAFLWSRHDEINHHKRRYRRPEFAALLRGAGYEIQMISYYNFWLFPLAAAVRLVKKALRREDEGDVRMPRLDFVNGLLRSIFASERFLLPHISFPFGLSIVAVCRRPAGEKS